MPAWMKHGDFHSTEPVWVRWRNPHRIQLATAVAPCFSQDCGPPFQLALGRTGGEDTEYFIHALRSRRRHSFRTASGAFEPVPENRARFSWLIQRRFRVGQTHGRLRSEALPAAAMFPQVALAAGKATYCFIAAAAVAVFPATPQPLAVARHHACRRCQRAARCPRNPFVRGRVARGPLMQPDVSFVIAAFNAEGSIARAVESALAQRG